MMSPEMREKAKQAIARIVDPEAFDVTRTWPDPAVSRRWRQQDALAKADEIAALLATLGAGEGWRPIESAPRDETAILACSIHHEAVEVVCWQDGIESGSLANLLSDDPEPEQGWVNDGPLKDRFYANPRWFTHWMPLPARPEQGRGGGG